ncbi:MAG: radical SAM protein [Bacteroidales bacterium]|nr:radical SAM protein [Bacteroidales bacterium]
MIDFPKLEQAYRNHGFYALQLEVGDVCHQGCIYCYMNALDVPVNSLSDARIHEILQDAGRLGITAVEWLGGEPLLRDSIFEHMAFAEEMGFRNNMWTGGLPLGDDEILCKTARYTRKGFISIHCSSVDPDIYARLHPGRPAGDLDIILAGVGKLLERGYPAGQMLNSVTFTGLQPLEDMIATIGHFEREFGIKTSLNVYHTYLRPDQNREDLKRFIPPAGEVKRLYERYSTHWGMEEYPMNCVNKQYCSATLAVLCDGSVTPCATIREKEAPNLHSGKSLLQIARENRDHLIFAGFRDRGNLPESCRTCRLADICFGCRSRAFAAGRGIYGKDPGCFR